MNVGSAPPSLRAAAVALLLWPALGGCAAQSAPLASAPGASGNSSAPAANDAGMPGAPGATARAPGGAPTTAFPPAPLPGGSEPTPDKALPELRIEALGMHVGGGKNSPEEKAPFHRAIEQRFPAFLDCYRLAEDPWTGGSFGIDIKISRAGGAPAVEQPRTRIRGAGFEKCMVAAFGNVQFQKPKAGPTVVSYSILFTLGKGKH